jgi:hypothetical protein
MLTRSRRDTATTRGKAPVEANCGRTPSSGPEDPGLDLHDHPRTMIDAPYNCKISSRRLKGTTFQLGITMTPYKNGSKQSKSTRDDSEEEEDRKIAAKKHNTRLRNGIQMQKRLVSCLSTITSAIVVDSHL